MSSGSVTAKNSTNSSISTPSTVSAPYAIRRRRNAATIVPPPEMASAPRSPRLGPKSSVALPVVGANGGDGERNQPQQQDRHRPAHWRIPFRPELLAQLGLHVLVFVGGIRD